MGLNMNDFIAGNYTSYDTATVPALELQQLLLKRNATQDYVQHLQGENQALKKDNEVLKKEIAFREQENLELAKEIASTEKKVEELISKLNLTNELQKTAAARRDMEKLKSGRSIEVDLYV